MQHSRQSLARHLVPLVATLAVIAACSSPTGSASDGSPGNADPAPSVSVSDAWAQEGDTGTADLTFSITLSEAPESGADISVDYSTADGSATSPDDYGSISGSLVFTSTDPLTVDVNVLVTGDLTVEYDESLQLILSNVSNATVARNNAVGTIISDDQNVTVIEDLPAPGTTQDPRGVVYDGSSLWVGEWTDQKVYEVNPATGATISSFSSDTSFDLAWDGSDLWADDGFVSPPSLSRYSTTGTLEDTIGLTGDQAYATAFAYDASRAAIWLANTGDSGTDDKVWLIDASDGSVLDSWEPSGGVPTFTYGMVVDSDPDFLWTCHSNILRKISIPDQTTVKEFTVPAPASLLGGIYQVAPGEFWLTDITNDRVFKIEVEG